MAKHHVAPHPINYAVWYDYVAETNPQLNQAIDNLIDTHASFNEEINFDLYSRYICNASLDKFEFLNSQLTSIMDGAINQVKQSGNQFSETKNSLKSSSKKLELITEKQDMQLLLTEIVHETQQLEKETQHLNSQLIKAQKEMEQLKSELKKTRKLATTDGLTGLLNRRSFDEELDKLVPCPPNQEHCLLILDLDHFKKVNDTFGHTIGDKVIRFTADLIKNTKLSHHLGARYGGEELALIMPETPVNHAIEIAESIRKTLESSQLKQKNSNLSIGTITASIGVTVLKQEDSAETAINRADKALYQAKQSGRNRVIVSEG
jgi:diguanylate cyclase